MRQFVACTRPSARARLPRRREDAVTKLDVHRSMQGVYSMTVREPGFARRRSGLLLLAPGLMLWSSVIAAPDVPSRSLSDSGHSRAVDVRFNQGEMTLDLTRAPWTEVLGEIARKTGIRFHYALAPQGVVTVSCPRTTFPRALECLLGHDAALMLRYAPGRAEPNRDPLPTDVWLLGQTGASRQGNGVVRSQSTDPQQATSPHPAATAKDEVRGLIDETKSDDPDARIQALGSLAASGQRSDRAVQEAFRAALVDEDGSVRAQGVYALSKGGGPEAMNVLRDALQDRDASVRLMAVDSAEPDEQGTALLQQALADSDETVRVLAAMKLKETEPSEGSARYKTTTTK